MAKPRPEDVRYFLKAAPAPAVAAALLGRPGLSDAEAARALAELAADRARLAELLAALPGGAVAALEVVARARYPMIRTEMVRRVELELGAGRGEAAVASLLGRGFLVTSGSESYAVWLPLQAPILELLEGVDLVEPAPSAGPPAPDRGALAIALLLAEVGRRRPRLTANGAVYRRDADELDRIFRSALGPGGAELVLVAFSRLGLTGYEEGELGARGSARIVVEERAADFLARPRRERVRAFARAHPLPGWLSLALRAGGRAAPREALAREAQRDAPWSGAAPQCDRWLGYCVAASLLDDVGGAYRASRELLDDPAPEPPASGRWLVQPTLEVVVPPDVPLAAAFRLACAAEVVSLDRAAVLRLTPASLGLAAAAGVDADNLLALLAAHAAAPLPDLVVRAVREGARGERVAWAYEGTVVKVPAEALEALRAGGTLDALIRSELAPGIFVVKEGAEQRFAKRVAAAGAEVRFPRQARTFARSDVAYDEDLADEPVLGPANPVRPPDPRLAAARARARRGDPAEFARTETPVVNPRIVAPRAGAPSPRAPPVAPLRNAGVPPPVPAELLAELNARLGRTLGIGHPAGALRRGLDLEAQPSSSPVLNLAWEEAANGAIAERRDLWVKLADEGRPRLVTPHRLVRRGDAVELEALAHDSGDLRAFDGRAIQGAAPGGASAEEHLPSAVTARAPLRAARNERCPCGSGRKYKACCLPRDLGEARA